MKRLIILCLATVMSCTSATSQKSSEKSSDMQTKTEIIASESQGGAEQAGFSILKNDQEFQKAIKGNSMVIVEAGNEPKAESHKFPTDKKVVLYNLGTFRSGDHRISEIKSVSVKDNVLYVEVPFVEHGGMEIQVISNPYVIFTVPSNYNFTSVELKSSK